ncbi:MAG: TDP-N-acetylfucosamine:lipid II N-acetylfucosaminyltransferase [Flavobacteriales bacterium]|nr:TDP-N-acetylfucosamine:lipid II N-acetylfucosaminyltransferase [Flavobacteriales bacterium]
MKKNILHVLDDEKFRIYCVNTFNISEVCNFICKTEDLVEEGRSNKYDLIVFHGLSIEKSKIINKNNFSVPIIWFFWGADAFCLGSFYNLFLLEKTNINRIRLAFNYSFIYGLKVIYKTINPKSIDSVASYKEIIKSFKKIKFIVPIVPQDYNLLKKKYAISSEMFHLNYVSPIFDKDTFCKGKNILLGNSAAYTNNHIEALDILSVMDLCDRKVYIPLSYGDKENANYISGYANKKLPNNSECIKQFMSLEEYQDIVRSCEIVIMNHLRQQALGNIIQALYEGVHLFLNEKSNLYKYLKQNEFVISSITNLELVSLSEGAKRINREKCIEIFGRERQHQKVKELIAKF